MKDFIKFDEDRLNHKQNLGNDAVKYLAQAYKHEWTHPVVLKKTAWIITWTNNQCHRVDFAPHNKLMRQN